MLEGLTETAERVVRHLPGAPNGLSVDELAEGLLGGRGPGDRSAIAGALAELDRRLGGLAMRRGDDDFGHADVRLYGLPLDTLSVVRRLCS